MFWPIALLNVGILFLYFDSYFLFVSVGVCVCLVLYGSSLFGKCGGPEKDRLVCLCQAQQTIWF